jgi:hypothetical protein
VTSSSSTTSRENWQIITSTLDKFQLEIQSQLQRLQKHFNQTFNFTHATENVDVSQDMRENVIDSSIQTSSPTIKDMRKAIDDLRSDKAAGIDQIPPEMLKADVNLFANVLYPIFKQAWELEKLSNDWLQGVLVKLPKKGDLSNCNN